LEMCSLSAPHFISTTTTFIGTQGVEEEIGSVGDDGPEAADLVVAVDDEFGLVGAGAGDDDVAVLAGAEE